MGTFELIDTIETKLLNYTPIDEVYYVERHKIPFSNVEGLCDIVKQNWLIILKNFINVLKVLYDYIAADDYLNNEESFINDDIYELFETINNEKLNDVDYEKKEKITKITLLLNIYASRVVPQGNPKYLREDGTLEVAFKQNVFFRGEDDYDYSLLPSIYRKQSFSEKGKTLDYDSFLFPYYNKRGLVYEYNRFQKYKEIDYNFCSLMQHAGCKSPLLDITQNSKIAISFASDSECDKDGSLYVFSGVEEVNKEVSMRTLDIFAIDRKLDFLTCVRNKRIILCNLNEFDVEFKILTGQTNDRMKFQEGAFLFLNKCIIVNGKLLLPISNKRIKKYCITSSYKKRYQSSIEARYQVKYLMDPYLFLNNTTNVNKN